ncbi:ww domain containing protein [Stylonychia lemnae]|uniref:Ww domain containing protein n=1 Tax=Stylonychia lemnae TaxID=5949 RepID=A0A078AG28_STYLE|nr:ww domain containing protein [Stylonychia lemnae]|eukprot:CDW79833.1 ww domain containing protein [Stylonychia lemnae]
MNTNKVKSLKYRKTLKKSIAKPKGNQLMKITMTKDGKNEEFYFGQDEVEHVAKEIGFDMDLDKPKYWWFFKQLLLMNLPCGWERETDIDGYTQYNNVEENYQTREHPARFYFRKLFLRILTLEQELNHQVTQEDIAMDETYIKILKAVYGALSIDFYTRNLKKKDKPKQVMSESLLGTNSRSKNRFQFMLNRVKLERQNLPEQKTELEKQELDQKIQIIQELEKESLLYYQNNFGDFLKTKEVIESFVFKQLDMFQILSMAEIYGIDILNESYLLWLPQYMMCLPLPPNWVRRYDIETNQTVFLHCVSSLEIQFHPVEPFAVQMIEKGRKYYNESPKLLNEIKNKLKTFDNMLRTFNLNMNQVRMFFDQQEKKKKKALQSRGTTDDLDRLLDDIESMDNAPQAQYVEEKGFSIRQQLRHKKKNLKNIQRDIEIFVVGKQCSIDLNQDIHFLYLISDLMDQISRQSDEAWQFRYINDDKFYWQNRDKSVKTRIYPFLSNVLERIQILKTQTENLRNDDIKNYLKENQANIKETTGIRGLHTFSKIKDERVLFTMDVLIQFMKNKENKLYLDKLQEQIEEDENYDNVSHDLRPISMFLANRLSKNQLLDVIYYCPFNLDVKNMQVIQDDLSTIHLTLRGKSSSSDSAFSSEESFSNSNPNKKKLDPRELLQARRQQSSFRNKANNSSNNPNDKSKLKSSNNLGNISGLPKKESHDVRQAMSILHQRKQTTQMLNDSDDDTRRVSKRKSDLKIDTRSGKHDNLNTDQINRHKNSDDPFQKQLSKLDKLIDESDSKNLNRRRKSRLLQKVESYFHNKAGSNFDQSMLSPKSQLSNNSRNEKKDSQLGVLQVTSIQDTSGGRRSKFFQENSNIQPEEDSFKALNFKSVGMQRKKQNTRLKQAIEVTNTSNSEPINMNKFKDNILTLKATPRTTLQLLQLKNKLLDEDRRLSAINRLKHLLRANAIKPEKFERMLKVSHDSDIAQIFKRLLIKYELVRILKENPNNPSLIRNLKKKKPANTLQDQKDAAAIIGGGIASLLGIIDKKKFELQKKPLQKQQDNDSFSIYDEDNNLKPFDFEKIADEKFDDLDITLEFDRILENYRLLAKGQKGLTRQPKIESPQSNNNPAFGRRNSILDIAGLVFVKNAQGGFAKKVTIKRKPTKKDSSIMTLDKNNLNSLKLIQSRIQDVAAQIQSQIIKEQDEAQSHENSHQRIKDGANPPIKYNKSQFGFLRHFKKTSRKSIIGGELKNQDLEDGLQRQETKSEGDKKDPNQSVSSFVSDTETDSSFKTDSEGSYASVGSQKSKRMQRRKPMRDTENLTAHELRNLKHYGGVEKVQKLEDYFKVGQSSNIKSKVDKEAVRDMKLKEIRLRRQGDFEGSIDKREDDQNEMSQTPKKSNVGSPIKRNSHLSRRSSSKIGAQILDPIQNQIDLLRLDSQDSDDVPEGQKHKISEFLRENGGKYLDMLGLNSKFSRRRQTLRKGSQDFKLNIDQKENVIEEENETESSFDLEQFKILQFYQSMTQGNSPIGLQKEDQTKINQKNRPFIQSLLRFKNSKKQQSDENNQGHNVNEQQSKTPRLISQQKILNFKSHFNSIKNKCNKFGLDTQIYATHDQERQERIEPLSPLSQQDEVDVLVEKKRESFLFYCHQFGNPKQPPHLFKYQETFSNMQPFHVLRMGQALGLIKSDQRNETYLLWIAQQLLAFELFGIDDSDLIRYEDRIQMIRNSKHPAFEYIKHLIHWQRKYFNEMICKQIDRNKFKKDCSWLAFTEDALDFKSEVKIGERVYYYNFYYYQKSLLQPDELTINSPNSYLFESLQTYQIAQTKYTHYPLTQRDSIQQEKQDRLQIERTFNSSILKTISSILMKRSKRNSIQIDRKSPVKKFPDPTLHNQEELSPSKIPLLQKTKSQIVQVKWNGKSKLQLTERNSISRGVDSQMMTIDSLPNLLYQKNSVDQRQLAIGTPYTAITSLQGTKLNSRDNSRENHRRIRSISIMQNLQQINQYSNHHRPETTNPDMIKAQKDMRLISQHSKRNSMNQQQFPIQIPFTMAPRTSIRKFRQK